MSKHQKPEAVFMMGGPGAGKSWVRRRRFPGHRVLCNDSIKKTHSDYDPKNPSAVHAWAKPVLRAQFLATLAEGRDDFVYDGTGYVSEKYVALMNEARAAGYRVVVCYVRTHVETAVARNAARPRTVPEEMLREKHSLIETSYGLVAPYADAAEVVDND